MNIPTEDGQLSLEGRIRAWAQRRKIPEAHLEKWLMLDEPARLRLLELAERLRFRTGQFVTMFTLLEEVSIRDRQSIADTLAQPAVGRIVKTADSGPGKARALVEEIRKLRYPRLHRLSERLATELVELGMPQGIKVVLPRDLASAELRIEIVAQGSEEIVRLLAMLTTKTADLSRIAAILAGSDEV